MPNDFFPKQAVSGSLQKVRNITETLLESLDANVRKVYILHQDQQRNTALMIASRNGLLTTVTCLLEFLDANSRYSYIVQHDWSGRTALMQASYSGNCHIIVSLLNTLSLRDRRSAILQQTRYGWNSLLFAADCGHLLTVITLLDNLGEAEDQRTCILHENTKGDTALIFASQHGFTDIVSALIGRLHRSDDRKKYIFHLNASDRTSLTCACANHFPSTITALLEPLSLQDRKTLIFPHALPNAFTITLIQTNNFSRAFPVIRVLLQQLFPPATKGNHKPENEHWMTENLKVVINKFLNFNAEPILILRLLHLLPTGFPLPKWNFNRYVDCLISSREQFLQQMPALLHLLNEMSDRNSNFTVDILQPFLSTYSGPILNNDSLTSAFQLLLYRWCQVLTNICDLSSLKIVHRMMDLDLETSCTDTSHQIQLCHEYESDFVPLKSALLQFVLQWQGCKHLTYTSDSYLHDCSDLALCLDDIFWSREFGSVLNVLPSPLVSPTILDISAQTDDSKS